MANERLAPQEYETMEVQTEPEQNEAVKLDIFAFLPENVAKQVEEIITIDAPPGYNNADGTRAKMQLKKLSFDTINRITKQYQKRKTLLTKKGRVATTDRGRPAIEDTTDSTALTNAIIAESLVHPDLGDMTLMGRYGVGRKEDMVPKMFPTQEAYLYMSEAIAEHVIGRSVSEDEIIEQAKN